MWWIGIEQMKLQDNEKRSKTKNILPFLFRQCSNWCGYLWDTIHNSLNHKSKCCSTIPFIHKLVHMMQENLKCVNSTNWVQNIINEQWNKTLDHQLSDKQMKLLPYPRESFIKIKLIWRNYLWAMNGYRTNEVVWQWENK